jgi:small-conductance mechanosensitive channel
MNTFFITLDDLYLENRLSTWLWALMVGCSVLLITLTIRRIIRSHSKRLAATPEVELIEVPLLIASRTNALFLLVISVFAGMLALRLPNVAHHVADKVLLIAACWQVGIWATTGALAWIDLKRRASLVDDRATAGTLGIIAIIVRGLIWAVVLLLTLDNLGVNITTLVAGLGIGGIAIALAVQNVLGDLLASLSITLDKPFVLGDSLQVDGFNGKVENIGIKSTRLRSVDGEQIIMPNSDLLKSRMRNFGRMQERRVVFSIGVTYETPRAKLEKVPGMVRAIVSAQDKVRLDRCHLARLNAYSIDCEVVYFMLTADYNVYMDTQQKIILALVEAFENEQIEFAYPTQRTVTGASTEIPTTTSVTA